MIKGKAKVKRHRSKGKSRMSVSKLISTLAALEDEKGRLETAVATIGTTKRTQKARLKRP